MTCPRRIRRNEVIESFCNGGHIDSTDCIDEEQGQIRDYIKSINSSIIEDYFKRMYATFWNCLKGPRVLLPTTCAWKIIEKPEYYGFKNLPYFVVSEAGISWDLLSHTYNDSMEILGATFLSGLVEHSMSCSLWIEETSGWVTTICPGSASKFAWGSSGSKPVYRMQRGKEHTFLLTLLRVWLFEIVLSQVLGRVVTAVTKIKAV